MDNKYESWGYYDFSYKELYTCNYMYTNEKGNNLFKRTKYFVPCDHIDYVFDAGQIEDFAEDEGESVDLDYIYKDTRFSNLRPGWNYEEYHDCYFLYNLKDVVADIKENKPIFFFKNEEEVETLKHTDLGIQGTCFADFPSHENEENLYNLLKILKGADIYIVDKDWSSNDKLFLEVLTKVAKNISVVRMKDISYYNRDFVQTFSEAFNFQYYVNEDYLETAIEEAKPINLEDFS